MSKIVKRSLVAALALSLLVSMVLLPASADTTPEIRIINPYAGVEWSTFGQYRTQLHVHTTASDGQNTLAEMVEAYYAAGYDVLAITDHGVVDRCWVRPNHPPFDNVLPFLWERDIQGLTPQRLREIQAGVGRDGRGMTRIPFGNEHNPQAFELTHLVSWFADWGHALTHITHNYSFAVRGVHRRGGISAIAHPSITYTNRGLSFEEIYEGDHIFYVHQVQRLFERYDSLIGIELFDGRDRKLWDILLQNLAPSGRNVFLIATDDSHNATTHIDNRWVVTLMPENTERNVYHSLRSGAFFSATRHTDNPQQIAFLRELGLTTGDSWSATRGAPEPQVTQITAQDGVISIAADNTDAILWVSNGEIIATGSELNLVDYLNDIGAYVRAELFGPGAVLYTQPFLFQYDGMPQGNPVPRDFRDPYARTAFWHMLYRYPLARVTDALWRVYLFLT